MRSFVIRIFVTLYVTIIAPSLLAPTRVAAQSAIATSRAIAPIPFQLAPDVTLRAPGSSRFAGEFVGSAQVDSILTALCASNSGTIAGMQHFAADSVSGAILLLRSSREGRQRLAWHEVLVYRLDESRHVRTIDLYMEDQSAWDRRFPRGDGVMRVSVATKRNVALLRLREPGARFVAGNADRVLVVVDQRADGATVAHLATRTLLVQHTMTPAGVIRETSTFAPLASASLLGMLGAH